MSFGLIHSSCVLKQVWTAKYRGRFTALFRHTDRKPFPPVVRNEICLLHEQARLRCCRWACGLPQTPHLRASQDSTWQSQLRSSSRSFPFLFWWKCFSLPPFVSSKPQSLTLQNRSGDTPNTVSTGRPHNSNRSSPSSAMAACWKECENSLDRCFDSERKTERGKQTYGKLKNWLA